MSKAKAAQNRRGSPEAIEKRRAARMFNDVLGGRPAGKLDGRTEKRRQRLLAELESGKVSAGGKRDLKPLDVLQNVNELLEMGESVASIRKVHKPKKSPTELGDAAEIADVIGRLHRAYGFRPEAYRFVGIGDDVLRAAGVLEKARAKKR
jgi:hypothetical protein